VFKAGIRTARRAKSSKEKIDKSAKQKIAYTATLPPNASRPSDARRTHWLFAGYLFLQPHASGQAHRPSPLWRIVVAGGGVILWVNIVTAIDRVATRINSVKAKTSKSIAHIPQDE
jgi:hypothetical protein